MACILRLPRPDLPGVVTFTTQERDRRILRNQRLRAAIESLKPRWLVGLHHNWHDFDFEYDDLFDFSMAGPGDLRERDGRPVPLVPLDACNFVPPVFGAKGEKHWDILYVARPVFFKGMPKFLETVRTLFDAGHRLRILCICPMPPYQRRERKTVQYDVEDRYKAMFSIDERRLFNLLVVRHDYPFPFDMPTLAHFYRSSRVFAHFAPDERRCRVAAYAWRAGLPVVAAPSVGSLLPGALRQPPAFYAVADGDYGSAILTALATGGKPSRDAQAFFSEAASLKRLDDALTAIYGARGGPETILAHALDLRLGRHHLKGDGSNQVTQTLETFVAALHDEEFPDGLTEADDPEEWLATMGPSA